MRGTPGAGLFHAGASRCTVLSHVWWVIVNFISGPAHAYLLRSDGGGLERNLEKDRYQKSRARVYWIHSIKLRFRSSITLLLKLITAVINGFRNKLECLSLNTRLAGKACQGQTLLLITETVKYGRNKFYEFREPYLQLLFSCNIARCWKGFPGIKILAYWTHS
jgi:hypothetical protein